MADVNKPPRICGKFSGILLGGNCDIEPLHLMRTRANNFRRVRYTIELDGEHCYVLSSHSSQLTRRLSINAELQALDSDSLAEMASDLKCWDVFHLSPVT